MMVMRYRRDRQRYDHNPGFKHGILFDRYRFQWPNIFVLSVVALSSTNAMICYSSGTTDGMCVQATISGTTISFGTSLIFYGGSTMYGSTCPLSSASIYIAYVSATSYGYGIVLHLNAYAPTFTSNPILSDVLGSSYSYTVTTNVTSTLAEVTIATMGNVQCCYWRPIGDADRGWLIPSEHIGDLNGRRPHIISELHDQAQVPMGPHMD